MPVTKEQAYEPLLQYPALATSEDLVGVTGSHSKRWLTRRFAIPRWLIIFILFLQTAEVISWIISNSKSQDNCAYPNAQILYSPAQDVIEYKAVKFFSGLQPGEQPDIYTSPPSPEVDAAWLDLYNFGISQIPQEQAAQLVNSTFHAPHNRSEYIVGIDVFHQLHCLNMIRKALYPNYYPADTSPSGLMRERHLSHCINSLRQSLQCSADISTIVWHKREDRPGRIDPRFDIVHSCRDFQKIQQWGLNHRSGNFADGDANSP